RRYEKHFLRDMKALRIDSVDFYARASDYVQEIIGQIKELIKRGYAYETGTGVYFNVRKFPRYGYLSRSRGEISLRPFELCSSKKWPEDFSLWRKSNEEPAWESPWGHGRPGWHIEDTAIAMKFFGSGYDLHGGASELIFPHHEAEIAQAEALTGKRPYVRFWIHTGLLKMRGRKMSKSLGNLIYIKEFLRSNDYRAARFYFLSRHYRQDVSFSTAEVKASARRWSRFIKHLNRFLDLPSSPRRPAQTALYEILKNLEYRFRKDMDDDFNTPAALRTVCRMASVAAEYARRQSSIEYRTKRRALEVIRRPAEILGII
ncbi:MAG: DALR domain-containing protein, partial [Candidatus Bathyarchaeia archaeon]